VAMPRAGDVAPTPPSQLQVREELGLHQGSSLAVFIYGGQPPGRWHLEDATLPPGWTCVVCSAGRPPQGVELPTNFRLAAEDAYTPDLVSKGVQAWRARSWEVGACKCSPVVQRLHPCGPVTALSHFNRMQLHGGCCWCRST